MNVFERIRLCLAAERQALEADCEEYRAEVKAKTEAARRAEQNRPKATARTFLNSIRKQPS
jgi:hypothetical protein